MNFGNEEFQFALEMIIVSHNEDGATLSDIRDDYQKFFGISFESMYGNDWIELIRGLLNSMDTIFTRILPGGYLLFFMKLARLNERLLTVRKNGNMEAFLDKLNIDPKNIKAYRDHDDSRAQSSLNSVGLSSSSKSSNSVRSTPQTLPEFYNHTLIADNFLLELSHIDLRLRKSKHNQIERIGLCISGQTMRSASRTILYGPYTFPTKNVILNIGTFDLLNGRSAENMKNSIGRLITAFEKKNLQPILTTLAPVPNHLDGELDENRRSFNKFIRENYTFIDIEKCFLSNERVLLECYQPNPKPIDGSKHEIILWNRVGRGRVLQLMKREIPKINPFL